MRPERALHKAVKRRSMDEMERTKATAVYILLPQFYLLTQGVLKICQDLFGQLFFNLQQKMTRHFTASIQLEIKAVFILKS
jgi:hypothetical protein